MKTTGSPATKKVLRLLGIALCTVCIFAVGVLLLVLVTSEGNREPSLPPVRTQLAELEKAINIYAMGHGGKLPETLEELARGSEGEPPLLKKEGLTDPWGTPFGYERKGRRFTITSAGPDRVMGTADDVTN